MLAASAAVQKSEQPDVLLERAIQKETVDGDLKAAIEQYQKLAKSSNRAGGGQALLRLALVYRKQGDAQARQTLERLVKDYSDQQQVVAEARGELARMGNGKPAPRPGCCGMPRRTASGVSAATAGW